MIRNNLRDLMMRRGLSIADVSRLCGLHRNVVGRVYRNEVTTLSFHTLDCLCEGLDVDTNDILKYVGDDIHGTNTACRDIGISRKDAY